MSESSKRGGAHDPARWQRIKNILANALDVEGAERAAFLAQACGDDTELRTEVESLLKAGASSGSPLGTGILSDEDRTPREDLDSTQGSEPTGSEPPRHVGPYRILQKIGEGGMGEVFLAQQESPIRRRVALKIIKPGMDSKQVLARFEAERQALALMNHPNVARVIDAGTTPQGRPYFTMEYVKGEPVTQYCDRHRLTTKERLRLFGQICEGVQHAHQKGIIHRDIKPSNVLVKIEGETPVPKIIDFGVAKATEHRLTEKTVFTELGVLIGTPEYMSPEQAEMTALDVDTRTDVYSLGVLLYELLVGALPIDLRSMRQAGFLEIQRVIRESVPPKPSTRIGSLGGMAMEAAKRRRTEIRILERQVRGDLDWIVMKAIEKDRTRRYPTPSELALDLERFLRREPVTARAPSAAYRLKTFVSRNRLAVFASALVVLALLLGLASTTWMFLQAEAARKAEARAAYSARIQLAASSIESGRVQNAQRWLSECSPETRGWEWGHLLHRIRPDPLSLDKDDLIGVRTEFAFPQRGRAVLVGSYLDELNSWTWDLETGKIIRRSVGARSREALERRLRVERSRDRDKGEEWISNKLLAVHPGGEAVLVVKRRNEASGTGSTYSKTLQIEFRSFDRDDLLWSLPEDTGPPVAASISGSGETIAIALGTSSDGERRYRALLLDVDTGRELARSDGDGKVRSVAISASGRWVAIGKTGTIDLWDTEDGGIRQLPHGEKPITAMAFAGDPVRLVSVGHRDEKLYVWDASRAERIADWTVAEHPLIVRAIASDGKQVLTAAGSHVRLWELETGRRIAEWPAIGRVSSLSYVPGEFRVMMLVDYSAVRMLDTRERAFGRVLYVDESPAAIGFDESGRLAVVGRGANPDPHLASTRRERRGVDWINPGKSSPEMSEKQKGVGWVYVAGSENPPSMTQALAAALFPGGERYVECSQGNGLPSDWFEPGIHVRDANSNEILLTLHGTEEAQTRLAVDPTARWVAARSRAGPLHLWDLQDGSHRAIQIDGELGSTAFSPDGRTLFAGRADEVISIDTADGTLGQVFKSGLQQGSESRQRIWDLGIVTSIAVSPNGRWIAATLYGGFSPGRPNYTGVVWDTNSSEIVARLPETRCPVVAMKFSPDGRRLALGSIEGFSCGGELRILAVPQFTELLALDDLVEEDGITSLSFSRRGEYLATGHLSGRVTIWASDPLNTDLDAAAP